MAPIISVDVEVSQCVEKLLCVCKYDKNINTSTFNNTVHCVQWSNDGKYLASGSADGIVTIWALQNHQNSNNSHSNSLFAETKSKNIENWTNVQQLAKHRDTAGNLPTDIQDLTFSPNDDHLISAGSDHNIIIWQKSKNSNQHVFECKQILQEAHHDLILGLSFDPIGDYLCSQSADGSAKIWKVKQNGYTLHNEMRRQFKKRSHFIRANTNDDLTRLDVCQRASWSPDGMHLVCSFGVTSDNIFISPIYDRHKFQNEFSFVGHSKPTTVSKWNPRIYQSKSSCHDDSDVSKEKVFFVAAVGSMDCKLSFWCSNRSEPLKVFSNIGRESILDIAWSRSGDICMACTHDGNVMAFVFGKEAFYGKKLSIDQHVEYVQHNVFNDTLHGNIMKNLYQNIKLTKGMRFNQVKSRDELQEKQPQNGHDMIDDDASSVASEFVCNEHMFAPEEEDETKLEIKDKYAAFTGIEGKQKMKMTDYYKPHKESNNSESDFPRPSPPSTPIQQSEIINTLVVRRKKKENPKSSKKKKKKNVKKNSDDGDVEMDDASHSNNKRKRKRHDENDGISKKKRRKIKIDHPTQMTVYEERGKLKVEWIVIQRALKSDDEDDNNQNETVSDLKQYSNSNNKLLWKTEIPSQITQIVVNKKWTICGTINGEIYCFDANGILIMHPIQMEEEIVFLSMSSSYKAENNQQKQREIFLMIITGDCTLREWKISNADNAVFEPVEVLRTNFTNLLRMNSNKKSKVSLKNGFITSNGEIMLTLSNDFIFTYKQSLNSWLRISDDKYWLSDERKSILMPNNEDGQIGKLSFRFGELMDSMNNSSKSVTCLDKVKNAEICRMHTMSHLEQELMTFTLPIFAHKEVEFENILRKYVEALIHSSTMDSLSFGIDKLNQVFERLLNRNCDGYEAGNQWPGSVRFQRDLLQKLLQVADERNNELQHMTAKYRRALDACGRNDII